MANWNAGAGFANSFLQTLQGLTAVQNAQMQNARMANAIQQEAGYEAAVAEEANKAKGFDLGQVAQKGLKFTPEAQQEMQAFVNNPNLTQEEKLNAIKGYAGTEYAMPTDKGGIDLAGLKAYQTAGGETKFNQLGKEALPSDVNRAVMQRMRESGNIYGQERALHIGKLAREDEAAQQEMDWYRKVQERNKLAVDNPTKFFEENLPGYNAAKKGSYLDDGLIGKVVPSADGKSSSFVQIDKKGNVKSSTLITPESAIKAAEFMAFSEYKTLPGKFKEAFTMGIEQEKLGETKRHNRAVEGIYGARLGASTGSKGMKEIKAAAQELADAGVVNPNTLKPFTVQEATTALVATKYGIPGIGGAKSLSAEQQETVKYLRNNVLTGKESEEDLAAIAKKNNIPPSAIGGKPSAYDVVGNVPEEKRGRPGAPAPAPAAPQQAIPVTKPDLSKWTMKPAGKTLFGETDYVLEGPTGRMSLSDFIDRYGYNPTAEFIGRR